MSTDIFSRWGSHFTDIGIKIHSSPLFMNLWQTTPITEWEFKVLEVVCLKDFTKNSALKGKALKKSFKRLLLDREKYHMSQYSIQLALNKSNKWFKKD